MELAFLLGGLISAVIKISIVYKDWNKEKSEDSLMFTLFWITTTYIVIFLVFPWKWELPIIYFLSYWNLYEIGTNFFHNKEIFYVRETGFFNKWLRKHTIYSERWKFFIHVITTAFPTYLIAN